MAAAGCATDYRRVAMSGRPEAAAALTRGYGDLAFRRLTADMDPAMMSLARRHDGVPSKDYWGRVPGWESYNLARLPILGVGALSEEEARAINALHAAASEPPPPARPFILKASPEDRAAAVQCLTQAIYYEAATEPLEGQQAVAQTVLNRVRHPGYPKSVCGVVFQGSLRATGCQFSFTCDGSLARAPIPAIWSRAQLIANKALNGFVMTRVGTATHYHADYVAPYWAPTLYKIVQIGRHIFYRWTGPWGLPPAFNGKYAGGEASLSRAILEGLDARTQGEGLLPGDQSGIGPGLISTATRTVILSVDGVEQTYTVAGPAEPGQETLRTPGVLTPSRRQPTPEEIADINAKLKAIEDDPDAPISTAPGPRRRPARRTRGRRRPPRPATCRSGGGRSRSEAKGLGVLDRHRFGERAGNQFQRHEARAGEGRGHRLRQVRRIPCARVVGRMPQHDHRLDSGRGQPPVALRHQRRAQAVPLAARPHSQRRQRGQPPAVVGPQRAEQDVADNDAVFLGDQFQQDVAVRAQGVDQVGLVGLAEGGGDHRADGGMVCGRRRADHHAPIFCASWWLIGWWAFSWSCSARKRTASRAAMQPMPAAVTAWR